MTTAREQFAAHLAKREEELFKAGKLARLDGGPENGMHRDLGPRDGQKPAKAWIPGTRNAEGFYHEDGSGYYVPSASDPFVYEWREGWYP